MKHGIVTASLALLGMFLVAPEQSFGQAMPNRGTSFKVRIHNISTPTTIKASNGTMHPAPNSPGVWVVHTEDGPFFTTGKPDRGKGLEAQAEEGNPTILAESMKDHPGVVSSGVFNIPVGRTEPGPALPGDAYEFVIKGSPGMRFSFASMFGQSNDHFYAPGDAGVALFDGMGRPISGNITDQVLLWDAGTEMDEEPGIGPNQAPRQPAPNTGPAEKGVVRVDNGYSGHRYPKVSEVLHVSLTPQ